MWQDDKSSIKSCTEQVSLSLLFGGKGVVAFGRALMFDLPNRGPGGVTKLVSETVGSVTWNDDESLINPSTGKVFL